MTENRDVYFDGSFSDAKGSYPIMLKFEMDDNYFPGVCYYHNINYGTKLKMSVRFTEEEMIIRGKANGSDFVMNFTPTTDGKWKGRALSGSYYLNAGDTSPFAEVVLALHVFLLYNGIEIIVYFGVNITSIMFIKI